MWGITHFLLQKNKLKKIMLYSICMLLHNLWVKKGLLCVWRRIRLGYKNDIFTSFYSLFYKWLLMSIIFKTIHQNLTKSFLELKEYNTHSTIYSKLENGFYHCLRWLPKYISPNFKFSWEKSFYVMFFGKICGF